MGLKCSVLGHKYGDGSVERDREEQGSEVVITIREVETCARCGTERIVSENKEVTAISTPEESDVGEAGTPAPPEPDDRDGGEPSEADAAEDPGPEAEPAADVEGAGGEILDAEAEEPVDDELADPSVDASAGTEAETPAVETDAEDDDAVVVEDETSGQSTPPGERGPGEWPDDPREVTDEPEWTPADADAEPTTSTDSSGAVTVPEGRFRCPDCGFTTPVESSSLRAGDFCPECRTGTLLHEADDVTQKG
jgi:hypothetical protein